jgi:hypothetical protein
MDYVELDVQKKLGPKEAWEFRRELRARVRKGTIINVYHLEDGSPDALIDYSDYIAVSIPELRLNVSMKERERIVSYISRRALGKGKRVHLLGCTEKRHLVAFRNCTSCDSTSFTSSCRWGRLVTRKGSMSCTSAHAQESGPADWPWGKSLYWGAVHGLAMYIQTAGRQD